MGLETSKCGFRGMDGAKASEQSVEESGVLTKGTLTLVLESHL